MLYDQNGVQLGQVNRLSGVCGTKHDKRANTGNYFYTPGAFIGGSPEVKEYAVREPEVRKLVVSEPAGELSKRVVTLILGLMFPLCILLTFFPFYTAGGAGYTIYRAYGAAVWYGAVGGYGFIGLFVAMCLLASKSDRKKIVGGFLTNVCMVAMILSVFFYVAGYKTYYHYNKLNHVWPFSDSTDFRAVSPGVFRSGSYGVVLYIVILLLLVSVVLSVVQLHQRKWDK